MKFTDLHRARWLKSPTWESDGVYENVAVIFKIWSLSQHFKREELNYMAQFADDAAIAAGEVKTGKAAIAERKKKRREGQVGNACECAGPTGWTFRSRKTSTRTASSLHASSVCFPWA